MINEKLIGYFVLSIIHRQKPGVPILMFVTVYPFLYSKYFDS